MINNLIAFVADEGPRTETSYIVVLLFNITAHVFYNYAQEVSTIIR